MKNRLDSQLSTNISTNVSTGFPVKSALTEFLADEEEHEQDFQLVAPDKYGQKNFFTQIKIFIGGKDNTNIQCDLSKKHLVKDVIKHVLTLYRKNKNLKIFECPTDQPQCFDLRHIDDDSDNSESSDD